MIVSKKFGRSFRYLLIILLSLASLIAITCIMVVGLYLYHDYAIREYVKERVVKNIKNEFRYFFNYRDSQDTLPAISINIPTNSIMLLDKQRKNRLDDIASGNITELIGTNDWEYVPATLHFRGQAYQVKIKLKGDMPSHYNRSLGTASYSIRMDDTSAILGLRKFSLNRTSFENFFYGYLFYDFFNREGFVTNDIRFVRIAINTYPPGIFFFQEGFEKELIESSRYREGLLLKFVGDCVDNNQVYNRSGFPAFIAYSEKSVLKNPDLSRQYSRILRKIDLLKANKIPLDQCLNTNLFAKYVALCDIFLGHHSYMCQNTKVYYNPLTDLLEPIAWDPNNFVRYKVAIPGVQKGFNDHFSTYYNNRSWPLYKELAKDSVFLCNYTRYLNEYLADGRIEQYLSDNREYIEAIQPRLSRQSFRDGFNVQFFLENIRNLKNEFTLNDRLQASLYRDSRQLLLKSASELPLHISHIRVGQKEFRINRLILPGQELSISLNDSLPKGKQSFTTYSSLLYPEHYIPSKGKIFDHLDSEEELMSPANTGKSKIVASLMINRDTAISSNLIIPENSRLTILPGVRILLKGKSSIISHAAITAIGTQQAPILIRSENSQGGVYIRSAKSASVFRHVVFEQMNVPVSGNWMLSGGFNCYESTIAIDSCAFNQSAAEDAVNIIRSHFTISNSSISDAFSDAFDSDFCKGIMENITIERTGNDGLDFSGSSVALDNIRLNRIGDKGISVGEGSTAGGKHIRISGAFIGIAAKDKSRADFTDVEVKFSNHPLVAYCKKPVFGPGSLRINNDSISGKELAEAPGNLIELNSSAIVNSLMIPAKYNRVFDLLYPAPLAQAKKAPFR